MNNEDEMSGGIEATLGFQSNEEVPSKIPDRVMARRRTGPMLDMGIVSKGQDAGVRHIGRKKVLRPIHGRLCTSGILVFGE